jgi:hypothetical protein
MSLDFFTFKIGSIPIEILPFLSIPILSVFLDIPIDSDGSLNLLEIGSKLSPSVILSIVSYKAYKMFEQKDEINRKENEIAREEIKLMQRDFLTVLEKIRISHYSELKELRQEYKGDLETVRKHYAEMIDKLS